MATYYAITTIGSGYFVKAYGANRQAVRQAAEKKIGDVATEYGTDIHRVTEHRNLTVVSKTTAIKKYGMRLNDAEQNYYATESAVFVK